MLNDSILRSAVASRRGQNCFSPPQSRRDLSALDFPLWGLRTIGILLKMSRTIHSCWGQKRRFDSSRSSRIGSSNGSHHQSWFSKNRLNRDDYREAISSLSRSRRAKLDRLFTSCRWRCYQNSNTGTILVENCGSKIAGTKQGGAGTTVSILRRRGVFPLKKSILSWSSRRDAFRL